jgi:thiol-disulfide isomerase/thioredoxin
MSMKVGLILSQLLWLLPVAACSQPVNPPSLKFGDPAPPLRVREWIKGAPVQQFEKGNVYVVELWATWCAPCKAEMPHLSALANEYKDRVTVIGVDIYEKKTTSMEKVKGFVDSMGHRMDYEVAAEDSNFIETDWLDASGVQGIPKSFVVNAEGRLAWIGHPTKLAEVLPKIVNGTWNINEALAKWNSDKYLKELDDSDVYEFAGYMGDPDKPGDLGKPEEALLLIDKMLKEEPQLKYAPRIAFFTFSSLLKTDPHKAFEFGKVVMVTSTYEDPAYDAIIDAVTMYSNKLKLPVEIYRLGAEACQAEIDQMPYPEIVNMPRLYDKMAEWYWRANDRSTAIAAEQKAIDSLKSRKDLSSRDLALYESRLQQYRKM